MYILYYRGKEGDELNQVFIENFYPGYVMWRDEVPLHQVFRNKRAPLRFGERSVWGPFIAACMSVLC